MSFLHRLVNDPETRSGRAFELATQFLIVASLAAFSIETLPDLTDGQQNALHVFETVAVALFSIEYVLRLATSERPLRFVFSFFGVVDLLAVLPFYLALLSGTGGIDLRSIRAFRLLRLFRVLKLVRYGNAISRFHRAFLAAREELILYFSVTMLLLYFSAVGIYYFENEAQPDNFSSIFTSLWWAVATLTTVGYGDVYPVTVGGRIFTFFVLMIGLGLVSVPAGLIAAALENARHFEETEEKAAHKPDPAQASDDRSTQESQGSD